MLDITVKQELGLGLWAGMLAPATKNENAHVHTKVRCACSHQNEVHISFWGAHAYLVLICACASRSHFVHRMCIASHFWTHVGCIFLQVQNSSNVAF